MKWLSIILTLVWTGAALAEDSALPAFHDVTGVASDDVLNVRAAPGVGQSIIAKLDATARDIEVVARNPEGDWSQINIGERAGWVASRFLARQSGQADNILPRPLACAGTEPFWSLTVGNAANATFSRMDSTPIDITTLAPVTSENRTDRYAIFGQGDESRVFTFMFQRDACSDGMSDRAYGVSVDLFVTEESGVTYLTGCCSLSR